MRYSKLTEIKANDTVRVAADEDERAVLVGKCPKDLYTVGWPPPPPAPASAARPTSRFSTAPATQPAAADGA